MTATTRNLPLKDRIEDGYDEAIAQRVMMDMALDIVKRKEMDCKLAHAEEYASAKNNDVRAVLMAGWLESEEEYQEALHDYREAKRNYRKALLNIERLKLLVAHAGQLQSGGV